MLDRQDKQAVTGALEVRDQEEPLVHQESRDYPVLKDCQVHLDPPVLEASTLKNFASKIARQSLAIRSFARRDIYQPAHFCLFRN